MRKVLLLLSLCIFGSTFNVFGQSVLNEDGTHTYYVATNGDDNNDGTINSPFATVMHAHGLVVPGDTVFIRGGVYKIAADATPATTDKSGLYADFNYFDKAGTAVKNICIWGYKEERPVFDFTDFKPANQRITAFFVTGDYYYFKNFEITGVQVTILTHTQSECFRVSDGNYNKFENLAMHDGQAIGYYLTNGIGNVVRYCDAYNNCDVTSEGGGGGNVDGFGCHPYRESGMGNKFIGCRAWLNSDDGFDLINAFAAVTFDSCWAFYNGYSKDAEGNLVSRGDGNGFKSGGYGMPDVVTTYPHDSIPHHIIEHCLAYYNKASGFYANHHLGGNYYLNNTAYSNGSNFNMLNRKSVEENIDVPGYGHVLVNNLSYKPRSTGSDLTNLDETLSTNENNSFTIPVLLGVDEDFNSLDQTQLEQPRQADGRLPEIEFMTLRTDKFVDKGQDLGFPFVGAAPDLGYHESTVPPVIVPVDHTLNPDGTHTYFVAPNGDDSNEGTIDAPFATIMQGHSKMLQGDTLYLRGGVYQIPSDAVPATIDRGVYADMNFFNQKGTSSKQFYVWGYKNERPVLDYSDLLIAGSGINAFYVTGNYYNIRNIEVTGLNVDIQGENQASGFRNDRGNHNTFENLSVHDGQANGYYITQGIGNLIHNSDAFNNQEADGSSEGFIDGFICRPSSTGGTGNQIIACRSWNNSDDGFDLSYAYTSVLLDSCWSFENGHVEEGVMSVEAATTITNGNGFVTGGYGDAATITKYPSPIPTHIIEHSIAYNNQSAGFTAGDHLGGNLYYNNTAYLNDVNFNLVNRQDVDNNVEVPGYGHELKNNISFAPRTAGADLQNLDETTSINTNNSFSDPSLEPIATDFNSLDGNELKAPRTSEGNLPIIKFMSLKSDKYVDKGVDVGLTYEGTAPDLGYGEFNAALAVGVKYAEKLQGRLIKGRAVLSWKTANETNNEGFEIQKSISGVENWKSIDFVKSHNKNGTRIGAAYHYTDQVQLTAITYYRLAQKDLNGVVTYSATISMVPDLTVSAQNVRIFPNPIPSGYSVLHLQFGKALDKNAKVELYDGLGHKVSELLLKQSLNKFDLKVNNLKKGIYFIKISDRKSILYKTKLVVY